MTNAAVERKLPLPPLGEVADGKIVPEKVRFQGSRWAALDGTDARDGQPVAILVTDDPALAARLRQLEAAAAASPVLQAPAASGTLLDGRVTYYAVPSTPPPGMVPLTGQLTATIEKKSAILQSLCQEILTLHEAKVILGELTPDMVYVDSESGRVRMIAQPAHELTIHYPIRALFANVRAQALPMFLSTLEGIAKTKPVQDWVASLPDFETAPWMQAAANPFIAPGTGSAERLTRQHDVFSAGVVFYWLLTGETPFRPPLLDDTEVQTNYLPPDIYAMSYFLRYAEGLELDKLNGLRIRDAREIPSEFACVIQRATNRKSGNRFESMQSIMHALKEIHKKTLTVRLVNAKKQPVAGVAVRVDRFGSDGKMLLSNYTGTTGEDGTCLTELYSGHYRVSVIAGREYTQTRSHSVEIGSEPLTRQITLEPVEFSERLKHTLSDLLAPFGRSRKNK